MVFEVVDYQFTSDDQYERYVVALEELLNCTVFHSVFRTQAMDRFNWDYGRVTDVRIIHQWILHGKIHYMQDEYFLSTVLF